VKGCFIVSWHLKQWSLGIRLHKAISRLSVGPVTFIWSPFRFSELAAICELMGQKNWSKTDRSEMEF